MRAGARPPALPIPSTARYCAVPLKATGGVGAGTAEVVVIVIVPFFAPIVPPADANGGANTTPIVQLDPALTVNVVVVGHDPAVVVDRPK